MGPTGPAFVCRCNYSVYYVVNGTFSGGATLDAIDSATGDVLDSFPVGERGPLLAADPEKGLLYLGSRDRTQIDVVDPKTQATLTTISPVLQGTYYNNFDVDPELRRLYVFEPDSVQVYDMDTWEPIDSFGVTGQVAFSTPKGMVAPTTHNLVLFYGGYPTGCGVVATLASEGSYINSNPFFCGDPTQAAISPDGLKLYSFASNIQSPDNNLHILNVGGSASTTEPLPGGGNIKGIGVNDQNGLVYLVSMDVSGNGYIYAYNPLTNLYDGPNYVGFLGNVSAPLGVMFDANNDQLLIRSSSLLVVVDTDTMTLVSATEADVPLGNYQKPAILVRSDPCCGAMGPTGPTGPSACDVSRLYALYGTDTVHVASTDTNKASDLTGLPDDILYAAGNSNTGVIWLAGSQYIYALYAKTEEILGAIPVEAQFMAVDPCRNLLYTSNSGSEVMVIDGAKLEAAGLIAGFGGASDLQYDPCMNRLYVSDGNSGVAVVDCAAREIIAHVPLLAGPPSVLALNPYQHRLYAVGDMSTIYPIDTVTLEVLEHLQNTPFDRESSLLMNTRTNMLYATGTYGGGLRIFSGNTGEVIADLSINASRSALDPQTNQLYFMESNSITVMDGVTNEVMGMVSGLQEGLTEIAVLSGCPVHCPCLCSCLPQGGCVEANSAYALQNGEIAVIDTDTHQQVGTIPLTTINGAYGLTANPDAGELYTASDSDMYFINAKTGAVDSTTFSSSILGILYSPATNKIYVTTSDGTFVLDGTTHAERNVIPGFHPGLAADTATGLLYAPNESSGVDVIDGESDAIVGSIAFAENVRNLAVDPVRHLLYAMGNGTDAYVADTTDGTILTNFSVSEYTNYLVANPVLGQVYSVYCDGYYCYAGKNSADGSYLETQMIGEGIAGFTLDPATGQMIFYDGENQRTVLYTNGFGQNFTIDMGAVYGYAFMKALVCPPELRGPTGPTGAIGPPAWNCNASPMAYYTSSNGGMSTDSGAVLAIDPASHEVVRTYPVDSASSVAVDPIHGVIAVGRYYFGLDFIGLHSGETLAHFDFGDTCTVSLCNPVPGKFYVLVGGSTYVYGVNPVQRLNTIPNAGVSCLDSCTNDIYGFSAGQVVIINGNTDTVTGTFPSVAGTASLHSIAIDPCHRRLYEKGIMPPGFTKYLASFDLDTGDQLNLITLGTGDTSGSGIGVNPATDRVYTSRYPLANDTGVFDGATLELSGTISQELNTIFVDQKTNLIYASDTNGSYHVIDGKTNQAITELQPLPDRYIVGLTLAACGNCDCECGCGGGGGGVGPAGPAGVTGARGPTGPPGPPSGGPCASSTAWYAANEHFELEPMPFVVIQQVRNELRARVYGNPQPGDRLYLRRVSRGAKNKKANFGHGRARMKRMGHPVNPPGTAGGSLAKHLDTKAIFSGAGYWMSGQQPLRTEWMLTKANETIKLYDLNTFLPMFNDMHYKLGNSLYFAIDFIVARPNEQRNGVVYGNPSGQLRIRRDTSGKGIDGWAVQFL